MATTATNTAARSTPDPFEQVWDIYDLYRDLRFNVLYYGAKLHALQSWNLGIEIAIAVTTSGTVTALAFMKPALPWFAGIAAILGVLKPLLNLPKRIERASKLWSGYTGLWLEAGNLVREVHLYHAVPPTAEKTLQGIRNHMAELFAQDDPRPNPKGLEKYQAEVNKEIPADSLWTPPKTALA